MVDPKTPKFGIKERIGFIRSELSLACPSVRPNDCEWILSLIVTEVEAAYAAARAEQEATPPTPQPYNKKHATGFEVQGDPRVRLWNTAVILCEERGHEGSRPCSFCRMQTGLVVKAPPAPDKCPTCGSDIQSLSVVHNWQELVPCADPWHKTEAPTPQPDKERCAICGWPLKASLTDGCIRGNCSLRPFPLVENFYDRTRAAAEYNKPEWLSE